MAMAFVAVSVVDRHRHTFPFTTLIHGFGNDACVQEPAGGSTFLKSAHEPVNNLADVACDDGVTLRRTVAVVELMPVMFISSPVPSAT